MLEWLRSGPHGAVLLAGSDDGLELIARNRNELVGLGYRAIEADDGVLLAMLDKDRTYALAREHGIPVPRTLALRDRQDVDRVSAEFSYPVALKPVHSHLFAHATKSGTKMLIVDSPAELLSRFEQLSAVGVEMLVTEVIAGPDDEYVSYYGYLDKDGQSLLHVTKRKIRQHPARFGIGTYHAMTHDQEVADAGLRFLQAVELRGLGNVEFKRDGTDGQLKLIECNARLTMSNDLIRRAGVDLALFCYNRALERPTPRVESYGEELRLWYPVKDTRAFLEYRRSGELSLVQWVRSLLHPQHFPVARLDDPLPTILGVSRLAALASRRRGTAQDSRPTRAAWEYGIGALTERVAEAGPRSYTVASRLDLLRSTGPGYVWRRLRSERHLSGLGEQARHAAYERIWREAADATGAQLEQLAPGLFELSRDGVVARVFQQLVPLDDAVTLRVALDKALVHRLLAGVGVAIPDYVEFAVGDPAPALEYLERVGGQFVVKPAAGTGGGSGTTAGIASSAELMRARLQAANSNGRLLMERQVAGAVYRLLLLDGELLDVVRSVPAHLTGDGRSTIEALIIAENERRVSAKGALGLSLLGVNLDMVIALERSGLDLSSVLAAGRRVAIGAVTNNNAVEENETFTGELSPQIASEAKTAQGALGLRLAGVDVITPDPSRPLAETGGVINEVNGTPGLHHHYLVADPDRATRVAIPVLERLLLGSASDGRGPGSGRVGSELQERFPLRGLGDGRGDPSRPANANDRDLGRKCD
jgi:cyanophycin synthetase